MDARKERRLKIENLRVSLTMLENRRRAILRELASAGLGRERRAEILLQRAGLQRAHDEAQAALRDLGERLDED